MGSHSVMWFGKEEELAGRPLGPGDRAPDFLVVDQAWKPVTLADTGRGARVFSAVPSLDTGTCSQQTRRFNEELAKLGGKVSVFTVSMDLPWAQKRFCEANGIAHRVWSDYRDASFVSAYGTMMKNFRLSARAVFVVDANQIIRHAEYVKDTPSLPDFDAALAVVRPLVG